MINEVMFLHRIGYKDLVHAISTKLKSIGFIIDETIIQIGRKYFWLLICIEPLYALCMESTFQKKGTCLLLEKFIRLLVEKYGKHSLYIDGGICYPYACHVLILKHYLHSS